LIVMAPTSGNGSPSLRRSSGFFSDDEHATVHGGTGIQTVKRLLFNIVAAAAIGFAIWSIMGAPLPSHPDAGVERRASNR